MLFERSPNGLPSLQHLRKQVLALLIYLPRYLDQETAKGPFWSTSQAGLPWRNVASTEYLYNKMFGLDLIGLD